jgi:hypothetical protein
MPIAVPAGRRVPGFSAMAPTARSGGWPGRARDETTLWLAGVPSLQAAFRLTVLKPAVWSALRADPIFCPMTSGTTTPGVVVVVDEDGATVVVVVVVVEVERAVSLWPADELSPHAVRADGSPRPSARAAAAERTPLGITRSS